MNVAFWWAFSVMVALLVGVVAGQMSVWRWVGRLFNVPPTHSVAEFLRELKKVMEDT